MVSQMPAATAREVDVTVVAVPAEISDSAFALLSAVERGRAATFKRPSDRAAFVTARVTLRHLLAAETGLDANAIPIALDASGRPYLDQPGYGQIDFNLSHSGALVAIAVARDGRVGVDVEWHDHARSLRDLVPQVMGVHEAAMLDVLDGEEFRRRFFGCWTRKEAVVKADGAGLTFPLRTIDVPRVDDGDAVQVRTGSDAVWSVSTYETLPGYTLSVAVAGAARHVRIHAPDAGAASLHVADPTVLVRTAAGSTHRARLPRSR